MSLTVLNVGYPLARVGPDAVGGAEQVLARLDEALVRAGHRSLVIASQDSTVAGTLVPLPVWRGQLDDGIRQEAAGYCRRAINQTLAKWHIDVVHLHGVDFYEYLPEAAVPVLTTLHLPPQWYPPEIFRLERPQTFLNCVSASQRRACPPSPHLLGEIENAVPAELLSSRHVRGGFALSLGRICPEKGFHMALDAARKAEVPWLLAGQVYAYPTHQQYFEKEIRPHLDRRRRFIGAIGGERKRRLLASAACLLAPSLVAETSSLVAIEALASGTPVVAFPSGALAELVEHGRTGFLVGGVDEMSRAIRACANLSSEEIRRHAAQRFSLKRMLRKYFELYHMLADNGEQGVGRKELDGCCSTRNGEFVRRGTYHG